MEVPRSMLKTRVRPGLERSRVRALEEENERFNPIRPASGNMVMRGGSDVVRSSRTPRLAMADSRAMEIRQRRLTPGTGATPTMGLSEIRGGAMERYVGCGAVPTMGLSEFRGGAYPAKRLPALKKALEMINKYPQTVAGEKKALNKIKKTFALILKHLTDDDETVAEVEEHMKTFANATEGDELNDFADALKEVVDKLSGLSGGASMDQLLDNTNVKRSGAYEGQGYHREKSMPPVAMRGGKYHNDGHALSDALMKKMGKAAHKKLMGGMMKHAIELHGGAWWDDLRRGFEDFGAKVKNEFVNPGSVLRQKVLNPVANEFVNPGSVLRKKVLNPVANEFRDPNSMLRGRILPEAAKYAAVAAPFIDAAGTAVGVPGVGTMINRGVSGLQSVNQGAKSVGLGRGKKGFHMMPDGSMMKNSDMAAGKKKKRAPASAGDGRRARAEIVRKVMSERGVKMIEASKIVKAEGLY